MALDLVRVCKSTDERTHAMVACLRPFREEWEPLAERLNLSLIPLLAVGVWLNEEQRVGLVHELEVMRQHILEQPEDYADWIVERIDGIVELLASGSCAEYEFVTG